VELVSGGPEYAVSCIGISGNKIDYIGTQLPADYENAEIIDGTNKLAAPGMVNTHGHVSMTLLRSYADDMSLMDWLNNKIWPVEARMDADDIYWGAMLAMLEMIKSGTTSFADMYSFMDRVAQATEESGLRGNLSRGLLELGDEAAGQARLDENVQFFKDWNGKAEGRIRVTLGPHAPYTCSTSYLKKIRDAAEALGCELQMHLAETKGECERTLKEYGKTPIEYAVNLGLADCGLIAAHCVCVTPQDIALMAEHNIRVAHNPQSNLKLASGIAPVPEMLAAGVKVGLGTDGPSSNNNLDLLEECRLAAMLHKSVKGDPLAVPAKKAWEMATKTGAEVLGFSGVGELKVGQLADIVLYNMQAPHWYPRHDRLSLLVYSACAADVDTVICDGKILLKDKIFLTLDEEKIYAEANACALRLTK